MKDGKLQIFPTLEHHEFDFTGNDQGDRRKLNVFSRGVKQLYLTRDSTKVYIVNFTRRTKYSSVIAAIDICQQIKNERFIWTLFEDKLMVSYYAGPPYKPYLSPCGGIIQFFTDTREGLPLDQFGGIRAVIDEYSAYWPSAIIFLFMLYVASRPIWQPKSA